MPSKIHTTHSTKPRKAQRDAGWDEVKQRTQYYKYASCTELKQTKESGRYPNRFRRLYETLLPKIKIKSNKLGKHVENDQKGNRARDQASHSRKQQTARTHSVCALMAQSPKTSQSGASLSSKVRPPPMKTVQPIRYQPPAGLPPEMTVRPHMLSSSQIQ